MKTRIVILLFTFISVFAIASWLIHIGHKKAVNRRKEMRKALQDKHWVEVKEANTIQGYKRYLATHPKSEHIPEAKVQMEQLEWQQACQSNRSYSYNNYIRKYPQGTHVTEAQQKLDSTIWHEAKNGISLPAMKQYLKKYPNGFHAEEARVIVDEWENGLDILDLIDQQKISVKTEGKGTSMVNLMLRRLTPLPITVRIPIGTFFVSHDNSMQDMVTTKEIKRELINEDWTPITVSAACANMRKGTPSKKTHFDITRSPQQEELAQILPYLNNKGISYGVKQAAVWIITDNADKEDFAKLISPPIYPKDIARAILICHEAGINIKMKAIWNDRDKIVRGVYDPELKDQLNQIEP